ncbi:MAG: polyprenyl synthetase family protein [Kiritimatiellia bacterium]|nr:polyprenyl synthetase family protein [Kiritimatiellia bacterium]
MSGRNNSFADGIERDLETVRGLMLRSVAGGWIHADSLDVSAALSYGKMLRARLALRMGPATGTSPDVYLRAAAAIEMVHAASLLHDDVIDGGYLRRGSPAFWRKHGASGAILMGDLLLCQAGELLRETGDTRLTDELMSRTAEMCRAEVEQELVLRGSEPDWETSVSLARRKTGSLFAFVAYASGVGHAGLSGPLREAGYLAGTAYQLSDDLLDAYGSDQVAGKTLGSDSERGKTTALTARSGNPEALVQCISNLRSSAASHLADWPDADEGWKTYWDEDLLPAMKLNVCHIPWPKQPVSRPHSISATAS